MRFAGNILLGKPEQKKSPGMTRYGLEDNIKTDLKRTSL
jgi:hypothetical protein